MEHTMTASKGQMLVRKRVTNILRCGLAPSMCILCPWYNSTDVCMMSNVFSFSNLIQDWLGFSEAIANVIQEEEF